MRLFQSKSKKRILQLEKENRALRAKVQQLEQLCRKKDGFFKELMSDALRHRSSLGAKHMADRKKYKRGK